MIVLYLQLLNAQKYILFNISGFILKILLKFRKFQSQYSYKFFSCIKKECMELDYSEESVPLATEPHNQATQPKHQAIKPSNETNVSQSADVSQAHEVASNKSSFFDPDSAQSLRSLLITY